MFHRRSCVWRYNSRTKLVSKADSTTPNRVTSISHTKYTSNLRSTIHGELDIFYSTSKTTMHVLMLNHILLATIKQQFPLHLKKQKQNKTKGSLILVLVWVFYLSKWYLFFENTKNKAGGGRPINHPKLWMLNKATTFFLFRYFWTLFISTRTRTSTKKNHVY